jgi:putative DNA primase/helicase
MKFRSEASSTLADLGISVRPDGPAEQRVPCSRCGHGPRDAALGVNIETGAFHCFRCGWSGRAGAQTHGPRTVQRIDDPAIAERKRERLRRIQAETLDLRHARARPIRQYLVARGLGDVLHDPPGALRAHPSLTYYDGGRDVGVFPALVALFTDKNGETCTLHATYLRSDGCAKAPVASPKKLLPVPVRGATRGGAIRLYPPRDGVLGVAEGIESALSMGLMISVPVWAASCADNLAVVQLPPLRELYIGVDVDASGKGESVAVTLGRRALRSNIAACVRMVTPKGEGPRDLNDELRKRMS